MYRDANSKYGGTIKENFAEAFDKYMALVKDLRITPEQSLQLVHNMLRGEALNFYRSVASSCSSIADARAALEKEFMSVTRQNAARRELDSLNFHAALNVAHSPMDALESLRTTITRVITQCPARYQGEKFRIDFLRRAIQSEAWAADPIARADSEDHSFTQFYNNVATRLALAIQNSTLDAKVTSPIAAQSQSLSVPIPSLFGEHYSRPPLRGAGSRTTIRPAHPRSGPFTPNRPRACFRCGETSHLIAQCTKPQSAINAGRERLLKRPAAEVLYEVLEQLDFNETESDEVADTHYTSSTDELHVFDTLLARSVEHCMASASPLDGQNFQIDPVEPRHANGIHPSDE
jgi:hypothetical protein